MDDVFRRIGELGVGLELEFEPTLLAGREGSEAFRERFRAYMRHAKETGVYGSRPIAYYHGTNGFYDLWASPDAEQPSFLNPIPKFSANASNSDEQRITEIAQMLSGSDVSQAAIDNAKSLLAL